MKFLSLPNFCFACFLQELLDAFANLAGEMNKLLMGFENSTFVKRLKAASRRQIDIAADLNNLDGFGLEDIALNNQPDSADGSRD